MSILGSPREEGQRPASLADVPTDGLSDEQREWLGTELRNLARIALHKGEPQFIAQAMNQVRVPFSACLRTDGSLSTLVYGGQITANDIEAWEASRTVTVHGDLAGEV